MYLYSLGHFLHIRWHNDRCKILLYWYTRRWGHTRLFQSSHTRRYLKSSRKNIQIIIKYYDSFLWNLAFVANGKALNASGNTAGDICEATFGTAGKWLGVPKETDLNTQSSLIFKVFIHLTTSSQPNHKDFTEFHELPVQFRRSPWYPLRQRQT